MKSAARTLVLLVAGGLWCGAASAQRVVEYTVPTASSGPFGITVDRNGYLAITEFSANKIAWFRPQFSDFVESTITTAASNPKGITSAADGYVWFVEAGANKIGQAVEGSGVVNEFGSGITANAGLTWITAGPDLAVWFTETNQAKIARMSVLEADAGTVTEHAANTPNGGPLGIVLMHAGVLDYAENAAGTVGTWRPAANSDDGSYTFASNSLPVGVADLGGLWVTLQGPNAIRTNTGALKTIPTASSMPTRIINGPDGALWFIESAVAKLGRISPAGVITEYTIPSPAQDLTLGPDGNLWFTEFSANKIAKFVVRVPGDVNDDGSVNVTDVFYLINFLFAGGPPPKP